MLRSTPTAALLAALTLAACARRLPPDPGVDPVDVAGDVATVLQHDAISVSCERYRAGFTDRRTTLLCGKWMFFYESFGTSGVPAALPKMLIDNFPAEIGPGMSGDGMIEDPSSSDKLPLGLAQGARVGAVEGLSYTCASCHFARLPDGRYAVGAPNHAYAYGRQMLQLTLFPLLALEGKPETHDPAAVAALQPLLDEVKAHPELQGKIGLDLLKVIPAGSMPDLSTDEEHTYASWPAGAMDFLMKPLPLDDHVVTVSKITPLWGIPRADEVAAAGLPHAMLGWTGTAPSVLSFLRAFIRFGGGKLEDWPDDKLAPLVEYVYSLSAPPNPAPPDAALVANGAALFASRGCSSCHDGPRGGGKRVYSYAEIGTDAEMSRWLDPDLTGAPCCGAMLEPDMTLTHGIKSPRLAGAWTQSRWLHDGALDTLDQLFCLGGARPAVTGPALGTGGHDATCATALSDDDKRALIAYLQTL